jgi:LacI family transcriptional regulator
LARQATRADAGITAGKVVSVGYQLMDNTRAALVDGILTLVISHPLDHLSDEVMSGMIKALNSRPKGGTFTSVLPFDIYTRENI